MKGADLTTGSLKRHLWTIAFPASLGFFFSTMYNVVDTWFAGAFVSTEALAAMARSFPVFFLFVITLEVGLSVGVSALVANAIGAGDREHAKRLTAQSLVVSLVASSLTMVIGFVSAPYLFSHFLGAEGESLELVLSYIYPLFWGCIPLTVGFTINGALQATGDTHTVRNISIAGFLLNFVLNYALVGPLGLAGIGWATTIIQVLNLFYFAWRLRGSGLFGRESWAMMRPRWKVVKEILAQSIPATMNMATVGVGIFVITSFVSAYGEAVVSAYGVATRIEQIVLLPCIGMNSAVLSITGQNIGAGHYARARQVLSLGLRYGSVIMIGGGILVYLLARPLMAIFTEDAEVIQFGVQYLRITVFLFLGYMVLFMSVAYLQGLKKPMFAFYMGLYRQVLMPILVFSMVVRVWQMDVVVVWWSIFFINGSAALICYAYAMHVGRKLPA